MRFASLLIVILFLLCPAIAKAQSLTPSAHPVKEIEGELKEREKREKALKEELQEIKSGLENKRKEMIRVAKNIKNNEQSLLKLEARIAEKETEQQGIEARLKDDRAAISDLILAMERMRRIPTEALLARPGAPLETAQSAMLLESTLPRVHRRAESLKADMGVLNRILEDLKRDRKAVLNKSKQLEISQKELTKLLSEREGLFAKTSRDVEEEQAALKRISQQARNLRDLVSRIEKKQREEEARLKDTPLRQQAVLRTPIPRAGQSQLPISGLIRTGYGKSDNIGAVSQGLRIESRPHALVVAPMGGVVDYAGAFKGYGQLIIIKHQKGYHSLIAGLSKIDTVVGRAVKAGEPIGKMSDLTNNQRPVLYYELRYKGNPVNPSKKISGLK